MSFRWVGLGLLAGTILLAACEPTATPFPVDIPTPATATPTPGAPQPIRYALAGNTRGSVQDRDLLDAEGQITELDGPPDPADLGTQYDLIAAFGSYADATPAPLPLNLSLIVNLAAAPLDDPALAAIILRGIDPAGIAAASDIPGIQVSDQASASPTDLKTQLANAGWPDGLDLILGYQVEVGTRELLNQFESVNIHLSLIPSDHLDATLPLTLVTWTTPKQREAWVTQAGSTAQVMDLFALPISYWAVPNLTIRFSPHGWPLAARS